MLSFLKDGQTLPASADMGGSDTSEGSVTRQEDYLTVAGHSKKLKQVIALGLQYDYAAFPEPLPAVPDYQERAPALHSVYPASTEQTLSLQEDAGEG